MKPQENCVMRSTVVVLVVALAIGCSKSEAPTAARPEASPEAAAPDLPGAHGSAGPERAPTAGVASLTGTVLETMDAAGYTYMKLKTVDGETWAAVNESKVAKGDTVTVLGPMPMDGFESATLKRKFDRIVFGTLGPSSGATPAAPAPAGGMAAAHGGSAVPDAVAAQHAGVSGGPQTTEKISVPKAEGAEGKTVAELFAQRAALNGKTVAVRGKVVKFNGGIMGKNWIHLRDGSGTPEGKDNDLTVTTSDSAAKGDVVLVRGTVGIDRDFGSGYTYALIVEDAKVTR
jgi:hypothetical protein